MGDYADDLINSSMMLDGMEDSEPTIWIPDFEVRPEISDEMEDSKPRPEKTGKTHRVGSEFEVSIIHRKTGEKHWTGIVEANSKKDAQKQFRIKYANIRNQYTHEYGLGIRKI